MNLVLLLGALLPWAATPASALFRVYLAIGLLSLEMQAAAWSGIGTLYTLPFLNVPVAAALVAWQYPRRPATGEWLREVLRVAPVTAILLLAALVAMLNVLRPLEAADPYHLERVAQIERLGTIEYDPSAEPKVNVMGWAYELALADVRTIPVAGEWLVRVHGVFGLGLYLTGLAAARQWLGRTTAQWPWLVVLVIPVVFHAFVLLKNDLLIAMAAFPALVWLVACARTASSREIVRAGALAGFAVGLKLTNLPLALLTVGGVVAARSHAWRAALGAVAAGVLLGAAAGGLFFTLQQNAYWYGDPLASGPVGEMGNIARSPAEAAESVFRFGISLIDLGLLTPRWWPGRGGWGGTFGLPLIWAAGVLLLHARRERNARWALALAAGHFLAFSAVFPDADVAHRLALASGILLTVMAADIVSRDTPYAGAARLALVPVLLLSAAQIVRSAVLYLSR